MLENYQNSIKMLKVANGFLVELPPIPQKNQIEQMAEAMGKGAKAIQSDSLFDDIHKNNNDLEEGRFPLYQIFEPRLYFFPTFKEVLGFLSLEMDEPK